MRISQRPLWRAPPIVRPCSPLFSPPPCSGQVWQGVTEITMDKNLERRTTENRVWLLRLASELLDTTAHLLAGCRDPQHKDHPNIALKKPRTSVRRSIHWQMTQIASGAKCCLHRCRTMSFATCRSS
eukprot:15456666-Alexandrium_andersonii.AAC.1